MKTFALAVLILSLGTVAMRSFTHATPQSVGKATRIELGDELSNVQTDLARLIDDLSRKEQSLADNQLQTLQVIDDMKATQDKTNTVLDQVVQQLRKSATVKYVTKSDLDSAIDIAKKSVEQVKFATPDGCDCDCGSRIADLEERIAKLEALCAAKPAQAYSTKSGGSTGSVAAQSYSVQSTPVYTQSGNGSNGSLSTAVSQPVYQTVYQPVYQETTPPLLSRTVTNTKSVAAPQQCYIDSNGNSVCPSSVQSTQTSRTTTISRPKLFRR